MNKKDFLSLLLNVGLLLIACGMVLPLFKGLQFTPFRYIFCSGAVITLISRLFSRYEGRDLTAKRLYRLGFWSAVLYCVGGFFLFYDHGSFQEALAFTLAGAVVQIYSSIRLAMVEKKLKKQG